MRMIMLSLLSLMLAACEQSNNSQTQTATTEGSETVVVQASETWRLVIELPTMELPVQLHLANDLSEAWFVNGSEQVRVPEITSNGDQLTLRFPAFNNTFELTRSGDTLEGKLTLVKLGYKQVMPVSAQRGVEYRFSEAAESDLNVTGRWETVFTEADGKQTHAVGEFDQQGSRVVGTFLTPKGDFRYLEGEVDGQRLLLSTFDGAHAFVFGADVNVEGTMVGDFLSGTRSHETWVARRNYDAHLPDAFELTFLKEGYETLDFSFPDLEGSPVSLSDPEYQGKVVLVTLSGTWCPNCADEVAFLSEYYRQNHQRGLEIITLLYEHFGEFELAAEQGRLLKDEFGVEYKLLVAGVSDKVLAAETLPMLNHVLAFPTMIFIDRSGSVRRIHTGFSGPGTGSYYQEFLAIFDREMETLLAESDFPDKVD